MRPMWLGPALYIAVSIFLWKYADAVFFPEVVARRILVYLPDFADFETVLVINVALAYFAIYIVVAQYLRNPYLGALALLAINLLVFYPIIGRGILGYKLPQGWFGASLPMLVAHWLFARGLQFQQR